MMVVGVVLGVRMVIVQLVVMLSLGIVIQEPSVLTLAMSGVVIIMVGVGVVIMSALLVVN